MKLKHSLVLALLCVVAVSGTLALRAGRASFRADVGSGCSGDGDCSSGEFCDVNGSVGDANTCQTGCRVGDGTCAPYECNGSGSCDTTCTDDSSCDAGGGAYCNTGISQCMHYQCNSDSDCQDSNMPNCVDHICMKSGGLVIHIDGHADVQVPCDAGDYACQAHYVCNAVTGMQCEWQGYDCHTGSSGSWYPPDGSSGSAFFNFSYWFNGENICAAGNPTQLPRYGISNHGNSYSHWERVDATGPDCSNPCNDSSCPGYDCSCTNTCSAPDPCSGMNCDDGDGCTNDWCDGGSCYHNDNGSCSYSSPPADPCSGVDCNDNNSCTDDSCSGGTCNHTDNGSCNTPPADPCAGVNCDDVNSCTNDWCDGGSCYHSDNGSCNVDPCAGVSCDDGSSCTNDSCSNGVCSFTDNGTCVTPPADPCSGVNCDDGSSCTNDWCDGGSCYHSDNGSCDPCAGVDCNDNNGCTDDSCSGGSCIHTDNGSCYSSSSADPCSGVNCDDGNSCTDDSCSGGTCNHTDNGSCNTPPADPCASLNCDDANGCTNDWCDGGSCYHSDNGSCNSDPCSGVNCDDANNCTNDWCDAGTCNHSDNGTCNTPPSNPCDGVNCDDASSCTNDWCDGGSCYHSDNGSCTTGPNPGDSCSDNNGHGGVYDGNMNCVLAPYCGDNICQADNGENCSNCADCGSSCSNLLVHVDGHTNVYVPCTAGDVSCQAHFTCNAVTGTQCVYQQYDCNTGYSGSWYPPDGSSGSSNFNFSYVHSSGNICAANNQPQLSRYGISNPDGSGYASWYVVDPTCSSGSECSGYACYNQGCVTSCSSDDQCDVSGGYVCDTGSSQCVHSGCTSDAQCDDGNSCTTDTCSNSACTYSFSSSCADANDTVLSQMSGYADDVVLPYNGQIGASRPGAFGSINLSYIDGNGANQSSVIQNLRSGDTIRIVGTYGAAGGSGPVDVTMIVSQLADVRGSDAYIMGDGSATFNDLTGGSYTVIIHANGYCTDDTQCQAGHCNPNDNHCEDYTCMPGSTNGCSPYMCANGFNCSSTCSSDSDCDVGAGYICNTGNSQCEQPQCTQDSQCDDANSCTDDSCVNYSCQNNDNGSCGGGTSDPCDGVDCGAFACSEGSCPSTCSSDGQCNVGAGYICNTGNSQCEQPQCTQDSQCDDANSCTDDSCSGGFCQNNDNGSCSSGPDCTNACNDPSCPGYDCTCDGSCPTGSCSPQNLGSTVPQSVSGNTSNGTNNLNPSCGASNAPDSEYTFTAPESATYQFDLQGSSYDTVIGVYDGNCGSSQLTCNDDSFGLQSMVQVYLTAGQQVTIDVDGYSSSNGSYTLNISYPGGSDCSNACNDPSCPGYDCTCDNTCSTCTPGNGDCTPFECQGDNASCYSSCSDDSQCDVGAGYVCNTNTGECIQPQCTQDSQCDDANSCTDDSCVNYSCQNNDNGSCGGGGISDPCDGVTCHCGATCSDGTCGNDECFGWGWCDEGSNTCVSNNPCDGVDCGAFTCSDGACPSTCSSDDQCNVSGGYLCNTLSGQCEEPQCTDDSQCGTGNGFFCNSETHQCDQYICPFNFQWNGSDCAPPQPACTSGDGSCGAFECKDDQTGCNDTCTSDSQCNANDGYLCNVTDGQCEKPEFDVVPCTDNSLCDTNAGYVCNTALGKCAIPTCKINNNDCGSFECVSDGLDDGFGFSCYSSCEDDTQCNEKGGYLCNFDTSNCSIPVCSVWNANQDGYLCVDRGDGLGFGYFTSCTDDSQCDVDSGYLCNHDTAQCEIPAEISSSSSAQNVVNQQSSVSNNLQSVSSVSTQDTQSDQESSVTHEDGGSRGKTGGGNATGLGVSGTEEVHGEQLELGSSSDSMTNASSSTDAAPTDVPSLYRTFFRSLSGTPLAPDHVLTQTEVQTILSGIVQAKPQPVATTGHSTAAAVTRLVATRADAAKEILQSFNLSPVKQTGDSLRDAVITARKLGIIKGYPDGSIRPSQPVTTHELTIMIQRAKTIARGMN